MTGLRLLPAQQSTGAHEGEVLACAYSTDAGFVLTSGWDGRLRCWETRASLPLSVIETNGGPVPACAFSGDSRHWLTGSLDGLLTVWDPITHVQIAQVLPHTRPVTAIATTASGTNLATASYDHKLVLYPKPECLTLQRPLLGHRDSVLGCCFSVDEATLLSWSTDGTVRLWDAAGAMELAELEIGGDPVTCAALSSDGLWMVAGTEDGRVQLWDLDRLQVVQSRMLREPLVGCYFLQGTGAIAAIDGSGGLQLFLMPTMEQIVELVTLEAVRSCACSPFGDQLVLGRRTGRPQLVAVEDTEPIAKVRPTARERSMLSRILGRQPRMNLTCPVCATTFASAQDGRGKTLPCPGCGQSLMVAQDSRSRAKA